MRGDLLTLGLVGAMALASRWGSRNGRDTVTVRLGVLTMEGRDPIKVTRIGKGTFSVAWKTTGPHPIVVVGVGHGAPDKEIMADAYHRDPNNPHLPKVVRLGQSPDGDVVYYTMPLYTTPLRKAHVSEQGWKDYRALKRCADSPARCVFTLSPYEANFELMSCVSTDSTVSPKLIEALDDLVNVASNYGSSVFVRDINPRNLASDEDGNLVLLDLVFDQDLLAGIIRP